MKDIGMTGQTNPKVVLIGFLCLVLDGFDLQAMSFAAPALSADWKIPRADLGIIFSAALLGLMVGSIVFGYLIDKLGRRRVMLFATGLFSVAALATAFVVSPNQLWIARLVTGLGLGGVIANAIVVANEFSSPKRRDMITLVVTSGLPLGGMLSGVLATFLLKESGDWRQLFIVGGTIPFALLVYMIFALPESAGSHSRAEEPRATTALPGRLAGWVWATALFALINFLVQLDVYFLANWIPTIVRDSGFSPQQAALAGTLLQLGAVGGAVGLGLLTPLVGFRWMIPVTFVTASILVGLLGRGLSYELLLLTAFGAGFGIVGAQPAVYTWAAGIYPSSVRGTGLGITIGVGRLGSILGPTIGGVLLSLGWDNANLFALAALPMLLAGLLAPLVAIRSESNVTLGAPERAS